MGDIMSPCVCVDIHTSMFSLVGLWVGWDTSMSRVEECKSKRDMTRREEKRREEKRKTSGHTLAKIKMTPQELDETHKTDRERTMANPPR